MSKKKLEYITKEYLEVIKNGEKLDRDDLNLYFTLIKEIFGESEASGLLNQLLASLKVKDNINPKDRYEKAHILNYKSLSGDRKILIDGLAEGLRS